MKQRNGKNFDYSALKVAMLPIIAIVCVDVFVRCLEAVSDKCIKTPHQA